MKSMSEQINIEMPILHSGQIKIIKDIMKQDKFYYVMNCSRQSGKTFMLEWLMLFNSLNNKSNSYFISPYYSQAKKSFSTILVALTKLPIIKSQSLTELTIELDNGSMMYFRGADNADALRGISPNYLYVDEFAFLKQDAWRQVLRPSLTVAGKKCFIASTPRTKLSDFYTMFQQGQQIDTRYLSFHMTYKDNPLANLEEIEDARTNLPEIIFRAEFEAEFIESAGEVFSNLDEASILTYPIKPIANEVLFAACDLGRVNDYTVLTIMDREKNVRFTYRERHSEWQTIVDNIIKYLIEYKVKKCLVESNSIGDVVIEMLKKKLPGVIEGNWTGNNKTDLIENLAVQFQNKTIKIPKQSLLPFLYNELTQFTYIWNIKSRTVNYGAPQGLFDDGVMSLAIANECVNRYANFSVPKIYAIKNRN